MSIFGDIVSKITNAVTGTSALAMPAAPPPEGSSEAAATPATSSSPLSEVDVERLLNHMAEERGGAGNWQSSIVDLLKLLDLPSSLDARKELADELNVHVGEAGSAEENIALYKAVMLKLEENGGKVPDSLKH